MDGKEDKDHPTPSPSTNPFALSGKPAAPSPIFGMGSPSTSKTSSGKPFSVMTSSTTTLARNLFAGSSDVTSSTSRMYPVSSIQGSSFGGSAFKTVASGGSSSTSTLNTPSGIFGTGSIVATSVASTFVVPVSSRNTDGFQNVLKQSPAPNMFGFAGGAGSGTFGTGMGGSDSQAIVCTSIPSVFGKISSTSSFAGNQPFSKTKSSPNEFPSTCSSFATSSMFGVSPSLSQSKVQSFSATSVKESSVFPGLTGDDSSSAMFNPNTKRSDSFTLISKPPAVFGGLNAMPTYSKKEKLNVETSVPSVFGGVSDSSESSFKSNINPSLAAVPHLFGGAVGSASSNDSIKMKYSGTSAPVPFGNIPSQQPFGNRSTSSTPESSFAVSDIGSRSSSFTTPPVPGVFGGKADSPSLTVKTVEKTASSVSNLFGGIAANSSAFNSTTSTAPAFLGKLPSTSGAGGFLSGSTSLTSQPLAPKTEVAHNVAGATDDYSKSSVRTTASSLAAPAAFNLFGGKTVQLKVGSSSTFPTPAGQHGFPTSDVPVKDAGAAFKSKPPIVELMGKDTSSKTTIFGGPTSDPSCVPSLFSGTIFGGVQQPPTAPQFPLMDKDLATFATSEKQVAVSTVSTVTSSQDEQNTVTSSKNGVATTSIPSGGLQLDSHIPDSTLINDDKMKTKARHKEEKQRIDKEEKQKKDVSLNMKPEDSAQPSFLRQKGKESDSSSAIFGGGSKTDAAFLFGGVQQPPQASQPPKLVEDSSDFNVTSSVFGGSLFGAQTPEIDHSSNDEKKKRDKNRKEEKDVEEISVKKNPDNKAEPMKKVKIGKEGEVRNLLLSDEILEIFGKDDAKVEPASPIVAPQPEYDKKDLTKIIIAQIPENCMDKDIIKNHFEKFGRVKRVFLNPKSNQATVQYEDHRGASKAKKKGHKIHPNLPEVKIFYGAPARRKSEDNTADAMLSKRKAIKTLQQTQMISSVKSPSDLDPYTPLDRPPVATSKKEVPGNVTILVPRKTAVAVDIKSTFSKREGIPKPVSPFAKERPPKISRMDSPKAAKLRVEDKQARGRSASPGKERNIFADVKSMKSLLTSQALTSNDKYNVLKARDKLMRNEKKRVADISKATSLDATCPDMCPELERYMRDVQNDLSSFEITNGLLDHKLVVKKFSRSSADKDEPLPHELRPGPVLLRTMDYLMCNIMVLCDKKDIDIGIWYNYLWDRTRAIRSDITQQQLTNDLAVTILERCVRFHIYAAVHLCEESLDVFDRKLNTENLTKSMQTLKELYKDLAEIGKFFPSECEFRAYEMLLHLNDGEKIVHQYSLYRDEVQKSPDVIYALKVFLALKSNNYVRFFKLIRSGKYLQGCILHRYFQQVRSKALDTYVKSYIVAKQVCLPLSVMIHTLGFEDESDAQNYLKYHGIKVEDGNVIIDKTLIDLHPEGQPPVTRPLKLIESNRRTSVVEVIQGGPLPENPLHSYVPHNSFDKQEYLKKEARDASDQWLTLHSQFPGACQAMPSSLKESQLPDDSQHLFGNVIPDVQALDQNEPQERKLKGLSKSDVMNIERDILGNITNSVVSTMSKEIAKDYFKKAQHEQVKNLAVKAVGSDILFECIKREVKDIGKAAFNEVQREEKERKRQEIVEAERKQMEFARMKNEVALSLCGEFTDEVMFSILRKICQESLSEVDEEIQCRVFDTIMKELPPKLLREVIQEEAHILGNEVFHELTVDLEHKIHELQNKILVRKMGEHFRRWRKAVLRTRRRKQSQATFPASCSQLSLEEQNREFSWGYKRKSSENISAESLFKQEIENFHISEKLIVRDRLVKAVAWYPLPIQHEVKKIAESSLQSANVMQQYFKLLLCSDLNSDSPVLQWLRSKLNGVENGDIKNPLQSSLSFISRRTGLEYGFSFCEVSCNTLDHKDLLGVSAALFVSENVGKHGSGLIEVQKLLETKPGIIYQSVITKEKSPKSQNAWILLEDDIPKPETSQKLLDVVLQMWNEYSNRCQIVSKALNNFVSGFVASHYIEPSLVKQQERCADGKSPLSPGTYLELYNAVITFLMGVIKDEEILQLDWPAPELGNLQQIPPSSWNKSDMKNNVERVKYMKLPSIEMNGFMPWNRIVSSLYTYVDQVSQPGEFSVELWSRVYCILSNTSKILEAAYNIDMEDPDVEVHVLLLPWIELIYACVSYKLNHLTDACVFYQPKNLKAFACPKSWWAACDKSDPAFVKTFTKEGALVNSRKRKTASQDDEPYEESKMPKLSSELLLNISREREKFEEFQKKLEMTLDDSSDLVWNETTKDYEQQNSNDLVTSGQSEELNKQHMEPVLSSELLSDLAREKEKYKLFQRKLESMLDEGEDLNFLFQDS